MPTIALFGTSADPPHRGHEAILTWVATQVDHVAVWTSDNPFKDHQTTLADRFHMLGLLIQSLAVPPGKVRLYPELGHMRTIVSIERARQKWPDADFLLVVGSDLVEQLPRWYRADDIFRAVQILVVPRPGHPVTAAGLDQLRQHQAQVTVADLPHPIDISSTHYRREDDDRVLPPAVQTYIAQNHLYSWPENSKEKLPTP